MFISFCSQHSGSYDLEHNKGEYNILNSVGIKNHTIVPYFENKVSLPKRYNETIKRLAKEDGILVLAHDDIVITDKNWATKLVKALDTYDVVGLAGGRDITIRQPCLWHLMCNRESHSGAVTHVDTANRSTYKTHFGKPGRVLLLDGLFLAFKIKTIIDAAVKFDETNPCIAHFYDIDFSLACNKAKLKLGTVNIDAIHSSPGLKNFTQEWEEGQHWFINKYNRGEY
jgi:GT2 family glycosyltransferase